MDPIINTEEYAWSDIKIVMLGRQVTGARAIKYGSKQTKEPVYAAGNEPVAMGRGNKQYSGEIKLLQSELEAIIASASGDPMNIPPFDVVVAYVPASGLPMKTDVLKFVEFDNFEKDSKQGDTHHEITMGLQMLRIQYNTIPS